MKVGSYMKKIKIILIGLITILLLTPSSSAMILYDDVADGSKFTKNPSETVGFLIENYTCNSCVSTPSLSSHVNRDGIGIFFKNNDKWQLSSFGSNYSGTRGGLNAYFTSFQVEGSTELALENSGYNKLTKKDETKNVTVSVVPEIYKGNSDFILLKYSVENMDTNDNKVSVATFSDMYLGDPPEVSSFILTYEDNITVTNIDKNIFKGIDKGFVGTLESEEDKKFIAVAVDIPSILKKDSGQLGYWTDYRLDIPSREFTNKFNVLPDTELPYGKNYTDGAFAYSWTGNVKSGQTVEFETLIGVGVVKTPTINIEKLDPKYNESKKEFNLTTDDENVIISGTITDKCGMGACTYNINGEEKSCDQATYYTMGSDYTTTYTATIPTEKLTDVNENTFSVTANSIACGTATDTTKFTLHKDKEKIGKFGINNNYITLIIILFCGIGLYIYSRMKNKFPQI